MNGLTAQEVHCLDMRALCPPGATFYTVSESTRSGALRNRYYVNDGTGLAEVTSDIASLAAYAIDRGSLAFRGSADPVHDFMRALYGEPVPDYKQEWL